MEKGVPPRQRDLMLVWVLHVSLHTISHRVSASSTGSGSSQPGDAGRPAPMVQGLRVHAGRLGCDRRLTPCFASPGGRTSCASKMAGCVTWRQRLSASCLLTRRKTSSPSPSTRTSLHSGRWPHPGPREPRPGRRDTSQVFPQCLRKDRAPVRGDKGG